jgi:hypothetical protein
VLTRKPTRQKRWGFRTLPPMSGISRGFMQKVDGGPETARRPEKTRNMLTHSNLVVPADVKPNSLTSPISSPESLHLLSHHLTSRLSRDHPNRVVAVDVQGQKKQTMDRIIRGVECPSDASRSEVGVERFLDDRETGLIEAAP